MSNLRNVVALLGGLLLTAAACAAPPPSAVSTFTPSTSSAQSTTRSANSTSVTPAASSTKVPVPWNPAGVRSVANPAPAAEPPPPPANLAQCGGPGFGLLPNSATSTSTSGGYITTAFVLQFSGSAPCSITPGFFAVDMAAADGTNVPVDAVPAGPAHRPLLVRPRQLLFGSIQWTVKPGLPHPTRLTFAIGDTPVSRPITLSVADVSIPPHSSTASPETAWQTTAYGLLTSSADPASLATLTATVTAPSTVRVPSTLRYSVTLTNRTNTTVPLTGCPQFVQQLSVVPLKVPTTVGARGPLNCSVLPRAITANSAVTMQMQLDTAGEIPGEGGLTWQLLDHGQQATAGTTPITVQ